MSKWHFICKARNSLEDGYQPNCKTYLVIDTVRMHFETISWEKIRPLVYFNKSWTRLKGPNLFFIHLQTPQCLVRVSTVLRELSWFILTFHRGSSLPLGPIPTCFHLLQIKRVQCLKQRVNRGRHKIFFLRIKYHGQLALKRIATLEDQSMSRSVWPDSFFKIVLI